MDSEQRALFFPPEYPFKPPGISMITPNGWFIPCHKICLCMSDYHPESWKFDVNRVKHTHRHSLAHEAADGVGGREEGCGSYKNHLVCGVDDDVVVENTDCPIESGFDVKTGIVGLTFLLGRLFMYILVDQITTPPPNGTIIKSSTQKILQITTFVLLLVMFLIIRKPYSSKTAKLPPGPWNLPFIGSLHHRAGSQLPHHALRDLLKKYEPLMHIQLGEIPAIVVSSPEMAQQVLKVHDIAFADGPQFLATKNTFYNGKYILFSQRILHILHGFYTFYTFYISSSLPTDSTHSTHCHKKHILHILHGDKCAKFASWNSCPQETHNFSSIRDDKVKQIILSVKLSVGLLINMSERISFFTSIVTARAAFEKRCKDQGAVIEGVKEVALLMAGFDVSDLFPWFTLLLQNVSGNKAKLENLHRKIDNIFHRIVSEHEENFASSGRGNCDSGEEDLVDVLLRHQRSDDLECPITTKNIKAVILDLISAGTETSSTTAAWAISELMKNLKAMEKAQIEVRKARMGKSTIIEPNK